MIAICARPCDSSQILNAVQQTWKTLPGQTTIPSFKIWFLSHRITTPNNIIWLKTSAVGVYWCTRTWSRAPIGIYQIIYGNDLYGHWYYTESMPLSFMCTDGIFLFLNMNLSLLLSFCTLSCVFQSALMDSYSLNYGVMELIRFERNLIDSLDNYFERQEKNGISFDSEVTK